MNKDELLEQARLMYLPGTIFKSINLFREDLETTIPKDANFTWYNQDSIIPSKGCGIVYRNGEWAEIVSKPENKENQLEIFKTIKKETKKLILL